MYSTYDEATFRDWDATYHPKGPDMFDTFWKYDFGKPGADSAGVPKGDSYPHMTDAFRINGSSIDEEVLVLRFEFEQDLHIRAGVFQYFLIFF